MQTVGSNRDTKATFAGHVKGFSFYSEYKGKSLTTVSGESSLGFSFSWSL